MGSESVRREQQRGRAMAPARTAGDTAMRSTGSWNAQAACERQTREERKCIRWSFITSAAEFTLEVRQERHEEPEQPSKRDRPGRVAA